MAASPSGPETSDTTQLSIWGRIAVDVPASPTRAEVAPSSPVQAPDLSRADDDAPSDQIRMLPVDAEPSAERSSGDSVPSQRRFRRFRRAPGPSFAQKRRWKPILIVVGSLLVLCTIGAVVIFTATHPGPYKPHHDAHWVAIDESRKECRSMTRTCPPRGVYPTRANCTVPPPTSPVENALFASVCLEGGTETPERRCHDVVEGEFRCACCGNVLFEAQHKCESGTGWPSFSEARCEIPHILPREGRVGSLCLWEHEDMKKHRVHEQAGQLEAVCSQCGAHLGDWFYDRGFQGACTRHSKPSRYCIDGVCLNPSQEGKDCRKPTL